MTGLALHLRARRAPTAIVAAAASTALLWAAWVTFSNDPVVAVQVAAPAVLFTVVAAASTLGGADEELDRTAARPWVPRRAAHLLLAGAASAALLLAAALTPVSFGPARILVRDAAGLLGLAALGATALGAARAWFAPVAWTCAAIVVPAGDSVARQLATWPVQPGDSRPAALAAIALALAGGAAYALRGSRARPAD